MKTVVYQILPRYWGNYKGQNVCNGSLEMNGCGHFADLDDAFFDYLKSLGCTHVWTTGVIRHATACDTAGCTPSHPQFVKGSAGSPYAITDYYDVNPYLAEKPEQRMKEFEDLVRRCHKHGLKLILDFVPNHVSRDNVNFGQNDDTSVHWKSENDFYYYPGQRLVLPLEFKADKHFDSEYQENPAKATGNNFTPSPSINDWYETVKLNYCDFHTETWDKMLDIINFWISKGVDGFRCDMVELVPSEFFRWLIAQVKLEHSGVIFIAEVYQKELYHKYSREIGFDYLYDKSGLYDCLRDIMLKNIFDSGSPAGLWQSTRRITANWQYLGDLQDQMLNFLDNHDEPRIASEEMAGQAANTFAALGVSLLFNRAAFMLYCGQELGENGAYQEGFSGKDGRNSIFDWWKVESYDQLCSHIRTGKAFSEDKRLIFDKYRSLLELAQKNSFANGQVYDLCFCNVDSPGFDTNRHFAFLRYDDKEHWLVLCNFSSNVAELDINIPPMNCIRHISAGPFDCSVIKL